MLISKNDRIFLGYKFIHNRKKQKRLQIWWQFIVMPKSLVIRTQCCCNDSVACFSDVYWLTISSSYYSLKCFMVHSLASNNVISSPSLIANIFFRFLVTVLEKVVTSINNSAPIYSVVFNGFSLSDVVATISKEAYISPINLWSVV